MVRGILFAVSAAATWGLVYVLEQKVLYDFTVAKFLLYQSLFVGLLAVVIILFFPTQGNFISKLDWKVLVQPTFIILMLATFVADFLILKAVQNIGATNATLFELSYPIFTVIFAFFILRQPIHWLTLVGGLLVITGSTIVVYVNQL